MSIDVGDTENIIELLGPREVVGQALGVLMASHDLSRDAAFEMLIEGSCGSHRRVREFAAAIVEQAGG
jgi:AmiR/NasT family two-component response regulator